MPGSLHCTIHTRSKVRVPSARLPIVSQVQSGHRCQRKNPFIPSETIIPIFAALDDIDLLLGPTKQHPKQIFCEREGSLSTFRTP